MSKTKHLTATIWIKRDEKEIEVALEANFYPGQKQTFHDPAFPDEVEIVCASKLDGETVELTDGEREMAEAALRIANQE